MPNSTKVQHGDKNIRSERSGFLTCRNSVRSEEPNYTAQEAARVTLAWGERFRVFSSAGLGDGMRYPWNDAPSAGLTESRVRADQHQSRFPNVQYVHVHRQRRIPPRSESLSLSVVACGPKKARGQYFRWAVRRGPADMTMSQILKSESDRIATDLNKTEVRRRSL